MRLGAWARRISALLWSIALLLAAGVVCQAQVTFTEYPVPTGGSTPYGITAGPDGNVWFAEYSGSKIGKITPVGVITEYPVRTGAAGITAGPDGNLWFPEEFDNNTIGRITPAGVITEFSIPGGVGTWITAGPDGNLWFTQQDAPNKIGRITPAGVITEFSVPAGRRPYGITAGPDGNLWFTEYTGNNIGRITPAGVITEFSIPTASSFPTRITAGPDGNLWFGEEAGNIGRITPSGVITEFRAGNVIADITSGPDGNLWFVEPIGTIGRITPAGMITVFLIPGGSGSQPNAIAAGPDGNLWFTEFSGNKIGKATLASTPLSILPTTGGNAGNVTVQIFGSGFQTGATVKLIGVGNDIAGGNTTVSNGSVITTTFELTGSVPGLRTVVITNPNNSSFSIPSGFTVEQGGAPHIWVDIIGRDKIRIGREQTYYVVYGNKGNVDAAKTRIWVAFPSYIVWDTPDQVPSASGLMNGSRFVAFDITASAGSVAPIPIQFSDPNPSNQLTFQVLVWREQ